MSDNARLVLFADDHGGIREAVSAGLRRLGYPVVVVEDGQAAIEAFRREPDRFWVVITDFQMPIMTGDQVAWTVHELRPRTPIILMSAREQNDLPPLPQGCTILQKLGKKSLFDVLPQLFADMASQSKE